ncbi:MAG TPA: DUF4097 family beta strand repeat-containing protein [Balneolales bacterium]|nr:DUF4097 family beta strand repeat-containing protein [Balneolales bacterium]
MEHRRHLYQITAFSLLLLSVLSFGYVSTFANIGHSKPDGQPYTVKEFNVNAPVRLNVRTSGGNIRVESRNSNSNKVRVEMYVRKGHRYLTSGDTGLKGYDIDISQHGNEINAIAHQRGSIHFSFGNQPSISFVVYTPKSVNGELHTSGGNISLRHLEGSLNSRTSGGEVKATDITGDFKLRTSGGNITVHHQTGNLVAHTSGGDIDLTDANGKMDIHTSGGEINLTDAGGNITGNTSGGSIHADIHKITNHLSLKTSGGNINAKIPQGQGYSLELRGESVHTNLHDFNGTMRSDKVEGTVRGGGPKVTLRTSGGSIYLND